MNVHTPVDSGSLFVSRQKKLEAALQENGLDALALNPGPSLTYLTGLHFHVMERPVVAFFVPGQIPTLVLPELEAGKAAEAPFEIQAFPFDEDPANWGAAFQSAARSLGLGGKVVGVEPTRLRFLELRLLEGAVNNTRFISAERALEPLRMIKDSAEIQAMQEAVEIAQKALRATLPVVDIGVTEKEIASELTLQLLRAGSDSPLPFAPIVSGGPNGANPHAVPGNRPLQAGDLLVIDWGATYNGYFSDLTRTFAIGEVDPEVEKIVSIVHDANRAARAAVHPGAPASAIDAAARRVIEAAGYGEYFIHRTGHGLGLEEHEAPYIRAGNPVVLEPGMTFTIEPGIYLPGRNGVRIEDDVVVTEGGGRSLSDMPRELVRRGG